MAVAFGHIKMPRAENGGIVNCLGRSRGGFTTKIHAVTDIKGRPLHVTLTPGNRHDMVAADELLEHAQGRAFIGDTGYDQAEKSFVK